MPRQYGLADLETGSWSDMPYPVHPVNPVYSNTLPGERNRDEQIANPRLRTRGTRVIGVHLRASAVPLPQPLAPQVLTLNSPFSIPHPCSSVSIRGFNPSLLASIGGFTVWRVRVPPVRAGRGLSGFM